MRIPSSQVGWRTGGNWCQQGMQVAQEQEQALWRLNDTLNQVMER
jgi:hypothetical protein